MLRTGRATEGFTLVELAIVLVVIGLLIGGILVAQSMISSARIVGVAAQVQQFDAGVENFKTKYNYLPGDAPAFDGDGNGLLSNPTISGPDVQNNASARGTTGGFTCEIKSFWNNINPALYAASNPICDTQSGSVAITSGPGANVPAAKIGAQGSFFVASAAGDNANDWIPDYSNPRNYYAILGPTQLQSAGGHQFASTDATNSAVKPVDALALDKKIDDGIANQGNVLSGSFILPGHCCGAFPGKLMDMYPLSTCSQGGSYQTQNNSYLCTPVIRIGAQTGDLQ